MLAITLVYYSSKSSVATIKHQRNTVPRILKLVFLEIPNVRFGMVFQNPVTFSSKCDQVCKYISTT